MPRGIAVPLSRLSSLVSRLLSFPPPDRISTSCAGVGHHHELRSVPSPHIEIDRRFLDTCRGWSMSLPGPNVRISLDPRHFAWPYFLRDPDPPATTADRAAGWPCRQWDFQGQRDRSNQQLQLAGCQRRQQSRSIAAGSHEPPSALPSVGRLAGTDPESSRLCTLPSSRFPLAPVVPFAIPLPLASVLCAFLDSRSLFLLCFLRDATSSVSSRRCQTVDVSQKLSYSHTLLIQTQET